MIPARMASTRYPGKPIIDICGLSMIEHVWHRIRFNNNISDIYIVTCDAKIKFTAENFGARVIMTSHKHERCSDRVAEGCLKLLDAGEDFDIVLNIQGDEPLFNPSTIDLLINPFLYEKDIFVVNLVEILKTEEEINNVNNVKVIFDNRWFALYFSRQPIPTGLANNHYKQLGAYAFSKEAIILYSKMNQSGLEIAESVDMLRFIENNIPIKIILSPYKTMGVDTAIDHEKVCKLMKNDKFFNAYNKDSMEKQLNEKR